VGIASAKLTTTMRRTKTWVKTLNSSYIYPLVALELLVLTFFIIRVNYWNEHGE
jgi:hypothetical protein